jgi:uncharacterized protein YggE
MKKSLFALMVMSLAVGQEQKRITVTGVGRATSAANVGVFTFDVTSRDSKPESAVADNQPIVRAFVDLLKRNNVDAKSVTITACKVEPFHHISNTDSKTDYVATTSFTIAFSNVGRIGDQLEKILASTFVTNSSGPKWMLAGAESVYTRAYANGLADCDAKASAMAQIIGKKIGRFVGVSAAPMALQDEVPGYEGGIDYFVLAAATKLPLLIPQRITVRAEVTATFELLD